MTRRPRRPARTALAWLRPRTRPGWVALGGYLALVLCGLASLLLPAPGVHPLTAMARHVALPPWAGLAEVGASAVFALPHALLTAVAFGDDATPAAGSPQEVVLVVGSLVLAAAELATTVPALAVAHVALVTAVARRLGRRAGRQPGPGITS